jgi:hypothetical protein
MMNNFENLQKIIQLLACWMIALIVHGFIKNVLFIFECKLRYSHYLSYKAFQSNEAKEMRQFV